MRGKSESPTQNVLDVSTSLGLPGQRHLQEKFQELGRFIVFKNVNKKFPLPFATAGRGRQANIIIEDRNPFRLILQIVEEHIYHANRADFSQCGQLPVDHVGGGPSQSPLQRLAFRIRLRRDS